MNKAAIFITGYIILFIIAIISLSMATERYYLSQFSDKNLAISMNIANNITTLEDQMNKTLHNAVMHLENYLIINPHPTRQQLIDLSEKLQVSALNFFDINGKLEVTSSDSFDNPKLKKFFKTYSIINEDPEWYEQIKKHDIYVTPIPYVTFNLRPDRPWKTVLRWNQSLGKFLTARFWGDSLTNILSNNIGLHKELLSIKVFSPSGKAIMEDQKKDSVAIPLPITKKYIEDPVIINSKHAIYVYFSFGGIKHSPTAKLFGLTNDNSSIYFYNIMLEFSKKNLNNQIMIMNLSLGTIIVLMFAIIYLVRNNLRQKSLHRLSLLKQANQIHHDVASPLMSLDWGMNSVIRDKKITDNDSALQLKQSIEAVKDIVNDLRYLYDDNIQKELKFSTELIYPIIHSAFSSSRLLLNDQQKDRRLTFEITKDWNLLVNLDPGALRRALLNLIKNAIESNGKITISLKQQNNNAVITISDTGKGIDANILKQMMSGKSITHGKVEGRGLGFSYAKNTVEQLGGTISLESEIHKGTKQIITFPISDNKPSWFVDKINLENIKTIVIVDDFPGIHNIWKEKLRSKNIKLIHIYSSSEFEKFIAKNKETNDILYLIDFSLEDVFNNGLTLITANHLQNKSILVTSKYLESFVKNASIKNGIKILPKEFIGFDVFV